MTRKTSVITSKTTRNDSVKVSEIPRSLHQALVRIQAQAKEDLDFCGAGEKAAILIDQNGKIFDEKVEARANTLQAEAYDRAQQNSENIVTKGTTGVV